MLSMGGENGRDWRDSAGETNFD